MAMIKCPECGQEISEKAKKCIHCGKVLIGDKVETKVCTECGKEVPLDATECSYCGCPIEESKISQLSDVVAPTKQKKNVKKIIIPVITVIIVAVIGITIYSVKVIKPKNTYNEAVSMLENGKYDDANKLFDEIKDYKDVAEIQDQLKYESYAYSAINSLKEYLKNPDSYQPYEMLFYASLGSKEGVTESNKTESDDAKEKYPVCIMYYGAQNGFGGNTTSYSICTYDSDKGAYTVLGTCDSLDEDEYDSDDEDDVYDLLICKLINVYRDGDDTIYKESI